MPETDPDLALIIDAARGAGAIARQYFGGVYRKWNKGKGELVTEADIAVDRFLRQCLMGAQPGYGWLSEESVDDPSRLLAEKTFVVDPIDGTIAFVRGRPHFTVSIAIVKDGRPVAACVLNPVTDECYSASAGLGAYLDDVPIKASERDAIEGCRMVGPKDLFEHPAWSRPPNTPWPSMHIEQRNSIAYRLALVAAGEFDAALALSAKRDWDLAAGDLIVHEAGGLVTDHRGQLMRYNGPRPIQRSFVAAGPRLHPLLLARVEHLELPERQETA